MESWNGCSHRHDADIRIIGGFLLDGSVRIEAADHAGRERVLRYCARSRFAPERQHQLDSERLL
jgi:hypothetical protein